MIQYNCMPTYKTSYKRCFEKLRDLGIEERQIEVMADCMATADTFVLFRAAQ